MPHQICVWFWLNLETNQQGHIYSLTCFPPKKFRIMHLNNNNVDFPYNLRNVISPFQGWLLEGPWIVSIRLREALQKMFLAFRVSTNPDITNEIFPEGARSKAPDAHILNSIKTINCFVWKRHILKDYDFADGERDDSDMYRSLLARQMSVSWSPLKRMYCSK